MRKLKKITISKPIEKEDVCIKLKRIEKKIKPTKSKLKSKLPRKKRKYYKKQQCAYIKEDGHQCRKKAVGKSSLCEIHGGNPVIKENLYSGEEEFALAHVNVKFNPAYHPIAYIELARTGLSDVEIAAEFGIATITIQDWSERFESFYTAKEVGKAMHESWWLRQGKDNMNERSFNTQLFKFMTMNKLGYSDKIEQKSLNMNVNGVLMVPDSVSEEEWEKDVLDV